MSEIAWLVFDLGQVVLAATAAYPDLSARLGGSFAPFPAAYLAYRLEYDRCSDPAVYWTAVARDVGAAVPSAALIDELTLADEVALLVPRPDTLELVEELRAAGYRLAVCSNAPSSMRVLIEARPWSAAFNPLVFSGELRVVKPEAAMYAAVLAATGGTADRTVLLDDRQLNVDGALAQGWKALRFTDAAQARIDLAGLGVALPAPGPPHAQS